jgi:5-methylcytosine-specific restriction protein B
MVDNNIPNKENLDQFVLEWNNKFLDLLIECHKTDPQLRFWLRVADRDERLTKGYWFQGTNYIYIGFSNKGDWQNKTRTIGFVLSFRPLKKPLCLIEVVFKSEKDSILILLG